MRGARHFKHAHKLQDHARREALRQRPTQSRATVSRAAESKCAGTRGRISFERTLRAVRSAIGLPDVLPVNHCSQRCLGTGNGRRRSEARRRSGCPVCGDSCSAERCLWSRVPGHVHRRCLLFTRARPNRRRLSRGWLDAEWWWCAAGQQRARRACAPLTSTSWLMPGAQTPRYPLLVLFFSLEKNFMGENTRR